MRSQCCQVLLELLLLLLAVLPSQPSVQVISQQRVQRALALPQQQLEPQVRLLLQLQRARRVGQYPLTAAAAQASMAAAATALALARQGMRMMAA